MNLLSLIYFNACHFQLFSLQMANSSRPPFPKIKGSDHEIVSLTEDYFLDSLERWREANKIEKFTLMGHSLGGYLSACYALKNPHRVEKLIMVSPAGIQLSFIYYLLWSFYLIYSRNTKTES